MGKLPPELLLLLCETLGQQGDVRTLRNCALTGKELVEHALLWLYRIPRSKVIASEGNEAEVQFANDSMVERIAQHKQRTFNWAIQWKSIIRSSLGSTAYPYCLYIRSLDLGDLAELFEDPTVREIGINDFFEGDMATFYKVVGTPLNRKTRAGKVPAARLNVSAIIDLVGESITNYVSQAADRNHSSVALEELKGSREALPASLLPRWTSRLPRLRSMTLWDGAILDGSVAKAIAENCPDFDDLTFYLCMPRPTSQDTDGELASFFRGLKSNTLKSLNVIRSSSIGAETLLSLNNHASSLRFLQMGALSVAAVKSLPLLKDCTALETIGLADADGSINLEANQNDVFLEIVSWLGSCDSLQTLSLQNFQSGPAILTPLCLRNNIRLRSLSVDCYTLVGSQEFHKAISHQTSLESLDLKADAEGAFRDDIDTLISSICELNKLTYLRLIGTSDYFSSPEIQGLASELRQLEEFHFGGYMVDDSVLDAIAGLYHLKVLNVTAVTALTFDGLLNYISQLQESNRGLQLAIMSQALEHNLSPEELGVLRKAISEKVDGKLDFILFREAESEFEESDSD